MNNPAGLHLRIANGCPNHGVHLTSVSVSLPAQERETFTVKEA